MKSDCRLHRLSLGAGAVLVLAGGMVQANPLVISEYVEGSSYNKAIEIANVSGEAVNLSAWELQVFYNGADTPGLSINLQGNIASGATHVFAAERADDAILAVAAQTSNAGLFNGDDAVVLANGGVPVDRVGQVGVDPGSAWSVGDITTRDATLRRRLNALDGDAEIRAPFDPALRFRGHPVDSFDGLGQFGEDGDEGGDNGNEMVLGNCADEAMPINVIQGPGNSTPLDGDRVVIEAVVSTVMPNLPGFYVEEEAGDRDTDTATSEGLYIYAPSLSPSLGERLRLLGLAGEYRGQTQLSDIGDWRACGTAQLPAAASLSLPVDDEAVFEALESQRVRLDQILTVNETYNLGRYGEVVLGDGRLFIPTQVAEPGAPAQAVAERNRRSRIILDDGSTQQNPEPIRYPTPGLSAFDTLRVGDTTDAVSGVLDYRFGAWRIQPLATPEFEATHPRHAVPGRPPATNLRVAAFNVLNFFNGDGLGGGFPTDRGADTSAELSRQTAKLVAAIQSMDVDVVGLMELENDGYGERSAIAQLTAELGGSWRYVDPGLDRLGDDVIAVGVIYRADRVHPVGDAATLADGAFADRNRQPLAQTFRLNGASEAMTVIVNHFKSKGCRGAEGVQADQGDGQGCWNPLRTDAARAIVDWAGADPTGTGETDVLVTGDLNAYAMEDPITALRDAGFEDLARRFSDETPHTYVFRGESGSLDHALASPSLAGQVRATHIWHSNADEPRVLDYNTEYQSPEQVERLYSPDAWRASDHDPLIVDIKLSDAGRGDINRDGRVDVRDLRGLVRGVVHGWQSPRLDVTGDGRVDFGDVLVLLLLIR